MSSENENKNEEKYDHIPTSCFKCEWEGFMSYQEKFIRNIENGEKCNSVLCNNKL